MDIISDAAGDCTCQLVLLFDEHLAIIAVADKAHLDQHGRHVRAIKDDEAGTSLDSSVYRA